MKLFRVLQFYPPPQVKERRQLILQLINKVVTSTQRLSSLTNSKTASRSNASHAIFFEAINLAIHYDK